MFVIDINPGDYVLLSDKCSIGLVIAKYKSDHNPILGEFIFKILRVEISTQRPDMITTWNPHIWIHGFLFPQCG